MWHEFDESRSEQIIIAELHNQGKGKYNLMEITVIHSNYVYNCTLRKTV